MYATHFDLDGRLFAPGIAQDDARFVAEREEDPALPAEVALSSPDSVLVLLGPPGVGKTTFAAHALRAASGGMRSAVAWLGTPPASAHELLEVLLAEFGFEPYRQSRVERLQTWRQFLIELGATETRVFVAVERAHDFDAPVLSTLDALTAADANGCPGASLVLMGNDELASRLDAPSLEPLRQRVRLATRLRPLDADSVDGYLRHAVARAGGNFERLFTADAVAALARHSRGIPRVLNHLADAALALAALRGAPIVDAERVRSVAAMQSEAGGRGAAPLEAGTEPHAVGGGTRAEDAETRGANAETRAAGAETRGANAETRAAGAETRAAAAPIAPAIEAAAEPTTAPAQSATETAVVRPESMRTVGGKSVSSAEGPAADDIPVLTEFVDAERDIAAADADGPLEPLDPAATVTLFGDDLDELSAEIAAEMLGGDADAGAGARAADAGSADAPAEAAATGDAIEDARRRRKQRRRATG